MTFSRDMYKYIVIVKDILCDGFVLSTVIYIIAYSLQHSFHKDFVQENQSSLFDFAFCNF